MTVAPTTTLLTPGVIPTTVEQFKGVPGPITVEGNFTIDALGSGQELFFRQLLNAPSGGQNIRDLPVGTGTGIGDGTSQPLGAPALTTYGTPVTAGITQIDADQGPIQITGTLAGGMAGPSGGLSAASPTNPLRVTISGTDYAGTALTETLTYTGPAVSRSTNSYFQTITSVTPINGTATTITLAGTSTRTGIEIASSAGYRLTPGLTIEAVLGRATSATDASGHVPNTLTDAYLSSFSFNATREDIITYNFGIMAKRFTNALNPAGLTRAWRNNERGSGTGAYGDGDFVNIQQGQTPFPGYGACLYTTVGTNRAVFDQVISMSINFDNNVQFTPRLCDIYPGLPYNRQRTITVEIELEYHSDDIDFANAYLAARTWEDVELVLANRGIGQFPDETRFIIKELQLSEYPSMPVESDDFVRQTIRGIALPNQSSGASDPVDALKVRLYQDNVDIADVRLRDLS